jgi:hypothetical protein
MWADFSTELNFKLINGKNVLIAPDHLFLILYEVVTDLGSIHVVVSASQ